ncbi:hypothetical protein HT031_002135 [Scenedesmus sp. PABB004]|nr:hypothetical protein HT031_002135 [Scenedesmus sp. PABB004]
MFFYVNLAKRLLAEHGTVQLSALGMAVSAMVSIAEILKKDGLVVETRERAAPRGPRRPPPPAAAAARRGAARRPTPRARRAAGLATCMDTLGGEGGRRPVQKAKMSIDLKKSDNFEELIAAEKERHANGRGGEGEEHEDEGEEEGEEGEEES